MSPLQCDYNAALEPAAAQKRKPKQAREVIQIHAALNDVQLRKRAELQGLAVEHEAESDFWWKRALCANTDPEAFFPEHGGSSRLARLVCNACEVRTECLEYALEIGETIGIWGGTTENERQAVLRESFVNETAQEKARRLQQEIPGSNTDDRVENKRKIAEISAAIPQSDDYYELLERYFSLRPGALTSKQIIDAFVAHHTGINHYRIALDLKITAENLQQMISAMDAKASQELIDLLLNVHADEEQSA